ncbi:calcium/sodium antiporter [Desulfobulbus elongatus]|uniref:calcium/sodium antiporter n=1 Tax=Desulfobulbus elongatus TaxID=53332 RepID=UPI000480BD00|nr:calcium/sodium antiporter [Desulfobulbus elongatus]
MSGIPLFLAGLVLLGIGAEMVVRGASRLAASLGVSPLVLGLTVVAIGTSMPELVVGITASWQGSGVLAVGNIAGTNLFNILFILGLSALLQPLPLHLRVLKLDLPIMIVAATLMTVMAWDGVLTRLEGGLLLSIAIPYTVAVILMSRAEMQSVQAEFSDLYGATPELRRAVVQTRVKYAGILAAGMGLTVLGADWLVDGAIDIARSLGISEALIGLTIVAIGTSAPELATTVVATLKGDRDVAVGNLLGSSIYNILVILGLTCLVSPDGLPVERQLLLVDIPLMAGVAFLCLPVFATGKRVSRGEGGAFVAVYAAYMSWLLFFRL